MRPGSTRRDEAITPRVDLSEAALDDLSLAVRQLLPRQGRRLPQLPGGGLHQQRTVVRNFDGRRAVRADHNFFEVSPRRKDQVILKLFARLAHAQVNAFIKPTVQQTAKRPDVCAPFRLIVSDKKVVETRALSFARERRALELQTQGSHPLLTQAQVDRALLERREHRAFARHELHTVVPLAAILYEVERKLRRCCRSCRRAAFLHGLRFNPRRSGVRSSRGRLACAHRRGRRVSACGCVYETGTDE
jgi:hypothetical protein